MHPYFIVNPIAGGGRALDLFECVKQILSEKRIDFSYSLTCKAKESAQLANRAYSEGERLIIAVGGDGTVSEVVSALYDKPDATMGIFPFGTGNDFARTLGLPSNADKLVELLLSGRTRNIDVGLANDTPYVNVAGLGFDVDVILNTDKYKKRFRGMLPYVFGIINTMFRLNRIPATVLANGVKWEGRMLICAVGNGRYIGGGMDALPNADSSDGLFDVCLIESVSFFTFLTLLPSFIKGKHLGKKPCRYFRASEVTINCDPRPLQLDGEIGLSSPVTFKILPSALRVVAPTL